MKMTTGEFKLMPMGDFDAKRGYSRWVIPSVGVGTTERESVAEADLWINPEGKLVTRFKSGGYTLHFEIKVFHETRIKNEMKEDIAYFLSQMLMNWVVDSVDEDLECDDVINDE